MKFAQTVALVGLTNAYCENHFKWKKEYIEHGDFTITDDGYIMTSDNSNETYYNAKFEQNSEDKF